MDLMMTTQRMIKRTYSNEFDGQELFDKDEEDDREIMMYILVDTIKVFGFVVD